MADFGLSRDVKTELSFVPRNGGSPLFASDLVFSKFSSEKEDDQAIFKLLIWFILPDDLFYKCLCLPISDRTYRNVWEIFNKIPIIKQWRIFRKQYKNAGSVLTKLKYEIVPLEQIKRLREIYKVESEEPEGWANQFKFGSQ